MLDENAVNAMGGTGNISVFLKGMIAGMDENIRKQMEENGVDVDETLKRFMGREAIFMKFIMKFADDQSCKQIRDGLENRDVQLAFDRAHSLKGVAGNLGIVPVYTLAAQISDLLRGKQENEVDFDQVMDVQSRLEEACEKIYRIIEEYKQ